MVQSMQDHDTTSPKIVMPILAFFFTWLTFIIVCGFLGPGAYVSGKVILKGAGPTSIVAAFIGLCLYKTKPWTAILTGIILGGISCIYILSHVFASV